MILITHIMLAIGSLLYSTYIVFSPSVTKLYASYVLVIATMGSGTYLAIRTNSNMLHACISGVLYLGITLTLSLTAGRTLAKQGNR